MSELKFRVVLLKWLIKVGKQRFVIERVDEEETRYRVSREIYLKDTRRWIQRDVNEPFYTLKQAKDYIRLEVDEEAQP